MKILRFYSHLSLALVLAFVFTPDTATAQGGEINVRGYFGTSIPSGQINATGSNGSFLGTVDSIDSATITRRFTIENTASHFEILTLTGTPKVSVSGPHADDFSVTQPAAIGILGGGSTTFEVTFTPGGGGIRDATITIPNSDPDGGENPYEFAIEAAVSRFHLTYSAEGSGTIGGNAAQNILRTKNGSEVTVVPNPGYHFVAWNDGLRDNPRRDLNVTEDASFFARYLTYTSDGSEITITDCDEALTGALVIPSTIDGLPVTSIGENAFHSCSRLTSIAIPEGVASIGSYAFYDCTDLTSATIPVGVPTIGDYAFWHCDSLMAVIIPEGVTSIGDYAFDNCFNLTEVMLPDTLTSIGVAAFSACRLEEIVIPDGITRIEAETFASNPLTSITLPESLTSIGDRAFENSYFLAEIVIPDGVTSIGEDAFHECESLTSIVIPASVVNIGGSAFLDCSSLVDITFEGDAPSFGSSVFSNIAADASLTVENQYATGFTYGQFQGLPINGLSPLRFTTTASGVTITFCSNLVSGEFIIPSNIEGLPVTGIGYSAFNGCSQLKGIIIPLGVTSIGVSAFSYCTSLTGLIIPEGVTTIEDNTFYNCNELESIDLPESVTSIGSYAFYRCRKLMHLEIPDSVTTIGRNLCELCTGLTTVEIGTDLTSISVRAFAGCVNLRDVTIGINVECIEESAFYGCQGLQGIDLPGSITSIERAAFYNTNLVSIRIPDSVVTIGDRAFGSCNALDTATIGNGVTSIGSEAFYDCTNMTSISLGSAVISIGDGAFRNCYSLQRISIPEGVTAILRSTFENCRNLEHIDLPETVASIGRNAFEDCDSLTCLEIPASVTFIGGIPSGLISLFFKGDAPDYDDDEFDFTPSNATVFYTSSASGFGSNFGGLPAYELSYTSTATNVTITACETTATGKLVIPATLGGLPVTSIGSSAFLDCSGLTSITIPASVTSIGNDAFYDCSSLEDLIFEGNAPALGADVFNGLPFDAQISVSNPSAVGFIYKGTFGGLPVTGLDPNADPYGTGVPNLLTYALFGPDRDPATVSPSELPKIASIEGNLRMSFTQPSNVSGVIYAAEWSSTLGNDWEDLPDTDADPDAYEFCVPIEGGEKFMRLKVTEL